MTGDEPPPRLVPTHSCLDLPLDPCHALVKFLKYSRSSLLPSQTLQQLCSHRYIFVIEHLLLEYTIHRKGIVDYLVMNQLIRNG